MRRASQGVAIRRVMMMTENSNARRQSCALRIPRQSAGDHTPDWLFTLSRWFTSLAFVVAIVAGGTNQVAAQATLPDSAATVPETPAAEKAASVTAAQLTDPPKANEHVIFVDENGEVVRLTAGGQIGEYLKWREQLLRGDKDKRPGYYIAAITLAGDVNAGRTAAKLDASIEVVVRDGTDHVEVPLRLNEATLLKHRQTASGDVEFLPADRGTGLKCRISKPGQHRIDLQLSVPVRKSGNSYRVLLSLPWAAQSSLRLVVPGDAIAIRPDELADIEVEALPDARSALIVHGLDELLDLPWQVVNTQPEEKTALQVETLMAADAGVDGVAIEAVQTITATGGRFDSIRVSAPRGFSVLAVSSPTHESIQTSDLQTNPVVISLQESTAGPVRLKWLLSSEERADANLISVNGFDVENATREETLVGISAAEGFRLSQLTPRPQQVQRISTSLFRKRVETLLDPQIEFQQAYRLAGQNSRVQFRIDRIEASYRVSPAYELMFREASADLTARFEIMVYRGSLDQVSLRWPGLASQEWEQVEVADPADRTHVAGISIGRPNSSVDVGPKPNGALMADSVQLQFVEPLNRTHGAVTIELRARRPVPLGEEPFLISIPMADSESMPVSRVTLLNANNVESTIAGAGDTDIRFLSEETNIGTVDVSNVPLNLVPRRLESASRDLEFRATVTTHKQDVTSSSHAVLTLSEDQINVEQRLRYAVTYEELDRLRILVPGSVRPDEFRLVAANSDAAIPLTAELGGLEIDGVRQVRVDLPEPELGQFEVLCSYSIPLDSTFATAGTADADVSLLQPAEIRGTSTRVEIRSPGNVGVQVSGEQWTQELTLSNAPSWVAAGMLLNVNLKLEAAPERASQNFVVRRSALRTRFQNGAATSTTGVSTRTTGIYLIDGDISFLTVTLPVKTDRSSLSVSWNGREMKAENLLISTTDSVGSEVRILVDESQRRTQHILTMEFDVEDTFSLSGLSELQTTAPRFAADVWLADTVWEVVLPVDQHLLVYPENYSPAFSWQRQGATWTRRPNDRGVSLSDWLLVDADTDLKESLDSQLKDLQLDLLANATYGNTYLFSAFGHQQELQFKVMSQPAIILAGAGLALALGLVLLRIPATRHVLTILFVGFGLSFAGLWRLEAVQLLLQPAVFGLVLAIVASIIETRVKRQQRASLVTFSSPSDFLVPGSSREEIIHDEPNGLSERPA
ncbi:MAG: hypothetical protein ACI93T_001598 [Porticoccaceae bacterium]|jgi:hypothetical protein